VQPARVLKETHLKLRAISAATEGQARAQDVLGWRMAERAAQELLLAGDVLDLAFAVDYNEHPEFGGVQLSLVDFARVAPLGAAASVAKS